LFQRLEAKRFGPFLLGIEAAVVVEKAKPVRIGPKVGCNDACPCEKQC
jgi:hypothetical protein